MNTPHSRVLAQLASMICAVKLPHPVRVAVDGVDGAGKTFLVDAVAPLIEKHGRPVIRASVDGFHNTRDMRHRRGADSPEGYYRDSFNYEILQRDLLIPLGPGGDRRYRCAAFCLEEDLPVVETRQEAPQDAILLFDGVFLLRPELIQYWDFSIFIEVDFNVSVPRAVSRDIRNSDHKWDINTRRAHYENRYVPGQQLYFEEANPREQASIIVDNNDFKNPSTVGREYVPGYFIPCPTV